MKPELLIAIFALMFSLVSFGLSFWHSLRSFRAGIRPVLVIAYDSSLGWVLRNIGTGPALNIVVAQRNLDGEWFNPVRSPALAAQTQFVLKWLGHVNDTGIGASYEDFKGKVYSSTCGDDLSRIFVGRTLPDWAGREIGRHWNQEGESSGSPLP